MDDYRLFVNGLEVREEGATHEHKDVLSVIVKGVFDEIDYTLVHNDERIPLTRIGKDTLTCVVSARDSVGYHSFQVVYGEDVGLFFSPRRVLSSHGKEMLQDFWAMMDIIFKRVMATSGNFVYADKLGKKHTIRNALITYNWVKSRIVSLESNILAVNSGVMADYYRVSRKSPAIRKINSRATRRHLQKHPELLTEDEYGSVEAGGRRFSPNQIVNTRRVRTNKTQENLQTYELVLSVYNDVKLLLGMFTATSGKRAFTEEGKYCSEWLEKLAFLRTNTFLSEFSQRDLNNIMRFPATSLQATHVNYQNLYRIYLEYLSERMQISSKVQDAMYLHVQNIEEIYRNYVAYVLADCFSMRLLGESLYDTDDKKRAMASDTTELYYKGLPSTIIGSWSSFSVMPDISLRFVDGDRTTMFLVKYTSREEDVRNLFYQANALVNSYDVGKVVIVTPQVSTGALSGVDTQPRIFGLQMKPSAPIASESVVALVT